MSIKTIPTFGGNDNENTSGDSDDSEAETTKSLELTDDELATYTQYEAFVDMGRLVSKIRKHDDGDDLKALFEWISEQKTAYGSKDGKTAKLAGNLPMVRTAFPVEDRCGDDYYVLPKADAAKVGIDYDSEDYILLPIQSGRLWTPSVSLGRKTYFDPGFSQEDNEEHHVEDEPETNDFEELCKRLGLDSGVVDANLEGYPLPSEMTVAEIRETITDIEDVTVLDQMLELEKLNEQRKTAIKAIEGRIRAVEDSDGDNPERFEGTETTEGVGEAIESLGDDDDSDDLETAKVEALKAAVGAIENLTETIQQL